MPRLPATCDQNCENKIIFFLFENFFWKKSKLAILVSKSAHKSLLIIFITFCDQTKIIKVTVR